MTKTGLIASSLTKTGLEKLINQFFFLSGYIITDDKQLNCVGLSEERLNKLNNYYVIIQKCGRWQFKLNQ